MHGTKGTATIEFALVAPVILLLSAGVLDYTLLLRKAIAVSDAARAGAQFGSLSTANAARPDLMEAAALNAAPDISTLTATAAETCLCSDGSTVTCGGSCGSGPVRTYVQVTAQATCTQVFSYAPLPFNGVVSAKATMRAQ